MRALSGYFDGDVIRAFEALPAKKNQKVIITILDEFIESEPKKEKRSQRGALAEFANPNLIEQEKSAWADSVRERYEAP